MRTYTNILFFIIILLSSNSIEGHTLNIESNSLAGTNNKIPFWFWANQLGRYNQNSKVIQHFGFTGRYNIKKSDFRIQVGTDIDFSIANKTKFYFTQLYGIADWKSLSLQAGTFADNEVFEGLSTTNGNISSSRNARPHPRIRAGFNRYVALTKWFSIYGFYEEGILNDNRYVENAHLHRKSLYLRFGKPFCFQFTTGLEHFVTWGGIHPVYGELQGWETYFAYVTGSKGDKNSLTTDQLNVMGNGYGNYQIDIRKTGEN